MKDNLMTNCSACRKEIAKGVKKCIHCGKDQRNFFMKHKILSVIIALFLISSIGAAIGTDDYNKDNSNNNSVDVQATKPISEELIPEIIITAPDLVKAYDSNEVKADKEYGNKVAEISGEVKEISIIFEQTYVILSSGDDYMFSDVQCYFEDEAEIEKIENLIKGQQITIVGKIDGKSMNIGVDNCIIK